MDCWVDDAQCMDCLVGAVAAVAVLACDVDGIDWDVHKVVDAQKNDRNNAWCFCVGDAVSLAQKVTQLNIYQCNKQSHPPPL